MLQAIMAALAPAEETEGAGLDDLVQALTDLTMAVNAQGEEIRAMRSAVLGAYPSSTGGPLLAA